MNFLAWHDEVGRGVPLPLRELEAETIQHELMLVREYFFRARFLRCKLHKLFHGMDGDVLIDGAGGTPALVTLRSSPVHDI